MSKRDRVAIVISIPWTLLALERLFNDPDGLLVAATLICPLFIYWSYQFISGDISFVKSNGKPDA